MGGKKDDAKSQGQSNNNIVHIIAQPICEKNSAPLKITRLKNSQIQLPAEGRVQKNIRGAELIIEKKVLQSASNKIYNEKMGKGQSTRNKPYEQEPQPNKLSAKSITHISVLNNVEVIKHQSSLLKKGLSSRKPPERKTKDNSEKKITESECNTNLKSTKDGSQEESYIERDKTPVDISGSENKKKNDKSTGVGHNSVSGPQCTQISGSEFVKRENKQAPEEQHCHPPQKNISVEITDGRKEQSDPCSISQLPMSGGFEGECAKEIKCKHSKSQRTNVTFPTKQKKRPEKKSLSRLEKKKPKARNNSSSTESKVKPSKIRNKNRDDLFLMHQQQKSKLSAKYHSFSTFDKKAKERFTIPATSKPRKARVTNFGSSKSKKYNYTSMERLVEELYLKNQRQLGQADSNQGSIIIEEIKGQACRGQNEGDPTGCAASDQGSYILEEINDPAPTGQNEGDNTLDRLLAYRMTDEDEIRKNMEQIRERSTNEENSIINKYFGDTDTLESEEQESERLPHFQQFVNTDLGGSDLVSSSHSSSVTSVKDLRTASADFSDSETAYSDMSHALTEMDLLAYVVNRMDVRSNSNNMPCFAGVAPLKRCLTVPQGTTNSYSGRAPAWWGDPPLDPTARDEWSYDPEHSVVERAHLQSLYEGC